jgi:hypothetical protein
MLNHTACSGGDGGWGLAGIRNCYLDGVAESGWCPGGWVCADGRAREWLTQLLQPRLFRACVRVDLGRVGNWAKRTRAATLWLLRFCSSASKSLQKPITRWGCGVRQTRFRTGRLCRLKDLPYQKQNYLHGSSDQGQGQTVFTCFLCILCTCLLLSTGGPSKYRMREEGTIIPDSILGPIVFVHALLCMYSV